MKMPYLTPGKSLGLRAIVLVAICGAATFLLGKDSNWDIFNYHLYIAHAFWTQDLQSDFMAAGPQRYLNPIGYLPLYWMIQAGWHSMVIALLLAAFHSLALVLLWEICARFLFKRDTRPGLLASLAVALAAMSPVFLGMLGGTYLDPPTLVLIFGGLLLLCFALERPSPTLLLPALAGCLLGIAAVLKLTNVIYVASAGVAILAATRFSSRGWRTVAWYGVGAAIGALLAGGWWSLQLYREFGNPFFPLFNEYFHSPDFAPVRLVLERFRPASFVDALTFPFDMASSHKWVYVENAAADIRFALLVIFALTLLVTQLLRRRSTGKSETRVRNMSAEMIIVFFLVSFPIWMATSGNGRYALPILLLVGPILILAIRAAIANRTWFVGLTLAILAMQGVVISLAENPRWDKGSWTANWIDVEVPAKLKESPFGYLSVGNNSNSFVALHVHPESRFVSMIGVFPLSLDSYGGRRVGAFISAHASKLRTLGQLETPVDRALTGKTDFSDYLKEIDGKFAMWDLRTDPTDCVPIKFSVRPTEYAILVSCALLPGNPRRAGMLPVWGRATRVIDRAEIACPALFSPRGGYTTKQGEVWFRHYPNTDVRLRVLNGHISYSRDPFGPFAVDMGTLEDWEAGDANWICAVPPPHWKSPVTR